MTAEPRSQGEEGGGRNSEFQVQCKVQVDGTGLLGLVRKKGFAATPKLGPKRVSFQGALVQLKRRLNCAISSGEPASDRARFRSKKQKRGETT